MQLIVRRAIKSISELCWRPGTRIDDSRGRRHLQTKCSVFSSVKQLHNRLTLAFNGLKKNTVFQYDN